MKLAVNSRLQMELCCFIRHNDITVNDAQGGYT